MVFWLVSVTSIFQWLLLMVHVLAAARDPGVCVLAFACKRGLKKKHLRPPEVVTYEPEKHPNHVKHDAK